jgi:hypothetical protein
MIDNINIPVLFECSFAALFLKIHVKIEVCNGGPVDDDTIKDTSLSDTLLKFYWQMFHNKRGVLPIHCGYNSCFPMLYTDSVNSNYQD